MPNSISTSARSAIQSELSQRLGHLAEQLPHLGRRLQVVVVAVELEAVGVAHQRAGLDAEQRVVATRRRGGGCSGCRWWRAAGAPSLRAISSSCGFVRCCSGMPWSCSSTKRLSRPKMSCSRPAFLSAASKLSSACVGPDERLQHVAAEAAGGGDDALAVLVEELPVDLRLAVVALQEGPAGELDEVAVAVIVLGQRGQVVVGLAAALALAAGVVHAAPHVRRSERSSWAM